MTKEDLYEVLCNILKLNEHYIRCQLDEFFSQNVCIPKGENRHPYADVLHEWIEDTSLYLESKQTSSDKGFYKVYLFNDSEYRIKPSEPIYEWQWVLIKDGKVVRFDDTDWYTEDDVKGKGNWIKIEETKRVRT